jgi:hypothetical protein
MVRLSGADRKWLPRCHRTRTAPVGSQRLAKYSLERTADCLPSTQYGRLHCRTRIVPTFCAGRIS